MHFMGPNGILGLTSPLQTSREPSPLKMLGTILVSVNGLSAIRVIAVPPPRLPVLGVDIYYIPYTMNLKGLFNPIDMSNIRGVFPYLTV